MLDILEPENRWEALVLTLSQLYTSRGEPVDPFGLAHEVRAVYRNWPETEEEHEQADTDEGNPGIGQEHLG
jgi:hypothetical protein